MSVHLNDLSKVYLQQVAEKNDDSYLETDMNKRRKNNEKAIEDMKNTEANKSMVKSARKAMGVEEQKKVKVKRWWDDDGDGIGWEKGEVSKKKKKNVKEGFSNWREDLAEVVGDVGKGQKKPDTNSPIKEKTVNNKININPEISEGVQIIESVELSEEYISETVYSAVDYFMAEGLNDEGVEILIDELGLDEFVSFVFEIGNEVITEARAGGVKIEPKTKGGKSVGSLKGGAKTAAINRLRKEKAARKEAEAKASESKPSGFKAFSQKHKAVTTAKKQQPSKKPVRDAIARGVFGAVKAYQAGMQRHKAAMSAAKETGKTIAKAAAVTHEAGRRAGQSAAGQAIKKVGGAVIKAGVEKAKKDIKSLKKESVDEAVYGGTKPEPKDTRYTVTAADKKGNTQAYKNFKAGDKRYKAADHLREKAESEQQQKLFGLALSVKRGQTPRSQASAEVLKIVDGMSEKKIRDFAKTKHEGIPKKVEEDLQPTTPDQVTAQKRLALAQDLLNKANKKALNKKVQKPASTQSSAVEEGKIPVTRQAGDFRYSGKTGEEKAERRAKVLSNSPDPQKRRQANTIRKTIKTVADRDTAQASSAARQKLYRGQQLRANDLANQLIKAKSNVNSGYELEGDLVNETTPLFYKLQKAGKKGSSTASAQTRPDADLERQKNLKMKVQQTKQRQERETDDDHPSLSARERNPNLR